MNVAEEITFEAKNEPSPSASDQQIYAAIAVFLYEENQGFAEPLVAAPEAMDPWKILARRESVG